ncbi:acetylxylan esterase [Cerasicoccus arenae]|uniref:Deacetylase n=1 Tax=Cerasicoccus arenae TaxID=424488 RepID=A0A8J3GDW4_9BACT|nr:acetylxylan esterase [Cerasicoccus arenae]MBK1857898.1 acetylxylan esterase [Cerasicoccus arenae]GHC09534.1 deacetylase [Cerasicoccus arenae]
MIPTKHSYPYDPTYGYTLETLLEIDCPPEVDGFSDFWRGAYAAAMKVAPKARIIDTGFVENGCRLYDIYYTSTDGMKIGGWLVVPAKGPIRRGFVMGHGYGGREQGDCHFPIKESAIIFPCMRGQSRSPNPPISPEAHWHVTHDIDKPTRYVIRGCVEDTWLAATVLLNLYPQVEGHLGYLGSSFGGGVGALALPWDDRFQKAHLGVPTFGNHPLRLKMPTSGSGESVRKFVKKYPGVAEKTLPFYDAAVAATHIKIPVHCVCALFDPNVCPPGQFAVYNALAGPKQLYVQDAGHFAYDNEAQQGAEIMAEIEAFFQDL